MKDNKVALTDEELDKDYYVTEPKKLRFSTKFIDICIACFFIAGGICLGTVYLFHIGIPGMVTSDIVLGSVFYGAAVLGIIDIFVVAKGKSLHFIGGVYPLLLLGFSLGNFLTITYQRLSNGWGFLSRTIWLSPVTYAAMSVLALIAFILYCVKTKTRNPRPMIASFALAILPTYAMIKGISVHIFGVFGEFISGWHSLIENWYSAIYLFGSLIFLLGVAAILLGYGVRLIDRGDNLVHIEPRIIEKPVTVTRRTGRGLLIIKSPKKEEEAPEEEKKAE